MRFLTQVVTAVFAVVATTASAQISPQQAFEKLKSLAGTWKGVPTTVIYKVTGAGSVVEETLFPGSPHEMVTMYHMDGEKLIATHYCAAHNQPTLRYVPGNDPKTLVFDFLSGTNMKMSDTHMHHLRLHLLDVDHISSEWSGMTKGKVSMTENFDLHRTK